MVKKTALKLVPAMPATDSEPPPNLGEHGATLWRAVMAEYDMQDAAGLEMLRQAASALDRAEGCAEHIKADGAVVRTKTGARAHPLLKEELANRAFVVRTLGRLGLDVEPARVPGRPPGAR